jgi:hypothetical protein
LYEFQGGHIGVFVGSRSQKELAPAISKWLIQRDAPAPVKATPAPKKPAPVATAKATPAAKPTPVAKPAPAAKPVVAKEVSKKPTKPE